MSLPQEIQMRIIQKYLEPFFHGPTFITSPLRIHKKHPLGTCPCNPTPFNPPHTYPNRSLTPLLLVCRVWNTEALKLFFKNANFRIDIPDKTRSSSGGRGGRGLGNYNDRIECEYQFGENVYDGWLNLFKFIPVAYLELITSIEFRISFIPPRNNSLMYMEGSKRVRKLTTLFFRGGEKIQRPWQLSGLRSVVVTPCIEGSLCRRMVDLMGGGTVPLDTYCKDTLQQILSFYVARIRGVEKLILRDFPSHVEGGESTWTPIITEMREEIKKNDWKTVIELEPYKEEMGDEAVIEREEDDERPVGGTLYEPDHAGIPI